MKFCASVLLSALMCQQQVTATSQDFISDDCFNLDDIIKSADGLGREECASEIIDAFDFCDEAAWWGQ